MVSCLSTFGISGPKAVVREVNQPLQAAGVSFFHDSVVAVLDLADLLLLS